MANFYQHYGKRLFDIVLAATALLLLSPIILVLYFLVRYYHGSPAFYVQPRAGKNETIFQLVKFRTMTNQRDDTGNLLPDQLRLTKFGKVLRKTSLDELPELWNIFKGEMSFVGPRPLSIHYTPFYYEHERVRHSVRPGLTGLAQINGRNNTPWEIRNQYDIDYVKELSWVKDLKILVTTFVKVVKQSDVTVKGADIASDFNVYRRVQEEDDINTKIDQPEMGSDFEMSHPVNEDTSLSIHEWLTHHTSLYYQYTLSGRSAIGLALDDVASRADRLQRVYLPSYLSVAMIQPFVDRNFQLEFYKVDYVSGQWQLDIDLNKEVDVFLYMEYFGFNCFTEEFTEAAAAFKRQGCIVLQDITHSLFRLDTFDIYADYYVASIRKWVAIASGGIAYKRNSNFEVLANKNSDLVVATKLEAMLRKQHYLNHQATDKRSYLKAAGDFENSLIRVGQDYTIDSYSLNYLQRQSVAEILKARTDNARYLYDHIVQNQELSLLYPALKHEDLPLVVPLVISHNRRDSLRQHLINYHVYLPIHWPERLGNLQQLQAVELSLVIDQRYSTTEMEWVLKLISEWQNQTN